MPYHRPSVTKLNGAKHAHWRLQMKLVLQAKDLWSIVNGTKTRPEGETETSLRAAIAWDKQDVAAQSLIVPTLDTKQTNHILSCETSADIWDKLEGLNSDYSILNRQQTMTRFLNYKIQSNQLLMDAYSEIEELWRTLNEIGCNVDETMAVTKIVSSLPDQFIALKKAWDSVPAEHQSMVSLLARLKKEELEIKGNISSGNARSAAA
ncbi:unnamed protein product [Allacma fusca]|uniref:DUF4219 domain-containing protein n=1 Tax=Allacma fusca TaxID=39272 RepID=A0A8J2JL21_9HEXA|nr:unnamed protein product [Allacma fusca]